jgi:hypothetical protein
VTFLVGLTIGAPLGVLGGYLATMAARPRHIDLRRIGSPPQPWTVRTVIAEPKALNAGHDATTAGG